MANNLNPNINNTDKIKFSCSSTLNKCSTTNNAEPNKHGVAYISFLKINGISFNYVSRMTPPKIPEIIPSMTAASKLTSNAKLF